MIGKAEPGEKVLGVERREFVLPACFADRAPWRHSLLSCEFEAPARAIMPLYRLVGVTASPNEKCPAAFWGQQGKVPREETPRGQCFKKQGACRDAR